MRKVNDGVDLYIRDNNEIFTMFKRVDLNNAMIDAKKLVTVVILNNGEIKQIDRLNRDITQILRRVCK